MEPLEKCLLTAKNSGVDRQQAEQLLSCTYVPLPWQWEFHAAARQADKDGGPVDIGVGGARGPGKSHAVLSQVAFDDCQRVPRLKVLFLRQTGTAAKESFDDLVDKVLRGHIKFERTGMALSFPNGSRIILGGFHNISDIDKYIGIEYDAIVIEELNQLTEEKHTKLRGSLRTSKSNWRPRLYTSFNPGGIGHSFVKDRYVLPHREKREKDTRFIGSTYKSNPYLNREYIDYLEGLTGDLGRAWREGDFDVFAGQVFSEFSRDKHVFKFNGKIKSSLRKVGGMDWGYSAPFVFLGSAVEEVNYHGLKFYRLWTYKEIDGTDTAPHAVGEIIQNNVNLDEFDYVFDDPSMHNKKDDGSSPIVDQLGIDIKNRWKFKVANNDRVGGWQSIHSWLSVAPDGLPYWLIADTCIDLARTLPELVYDDTKTEDVDTNTNDHWGDSARYMLHYSKFIEANFKQARTKPKSVTIDGQLVTKTPLEQLDLTKFAKARPTQKDWRR